MRDPRREVGHVHQTRTTTPLTSRLLWALAGATTFTAIMFFLDLI